MRPMQKYQWFVAAFAAFALGAMLGSLYRGEWFYATAQAGFVTWFAYRWWWARRIDEKVSKQSASVQHAARQSAGASTVEPGSTSARKG